MFYHDGARISTLAPRGLLDRLDVHETISVYHARDVLWTVDYYASLQDVGDGSPGPSGETQDCSDDSYEEADDDDDDDDQRPYDDWEELTFDRAGQPGHVMSIAGRRLLETRLITQRAGQDWVQHFIPDRYQSRTAASTQTEGGLAGDLTLLIGLVAMPMGPAQWATYVPPTMAAQGIAAGQWQVSPAQVDNMPRGSNCKSALLESVLPDAMDSYHLTRDRQKRYRRYRVHGSRWYILPGPARLR